jgi:hypothetical protein
MKNLVLIAVAFFAVQSVAMACPNLTGNYVSATGEKLVVKHEGTNLQLNDEEPAIIDGAQHEINFDGGMRIVYTGICPSETQIVLKMTAYVPGGQMDVTQTLTVTDKGFHMSMTGAQSREEEYTRE